MRREGGGRWRGEGWREWALNSPTLWMETCVGPYRTNVLLWVYPDALGASHCGAKLQIVLEGCWVDQPMISKEKFRDQFYFNFQEMFDIWDLYTIPFLASQGPNGGSRFTQPLVNTMGIIISIILQKTTLPTSRQPHLPHAEETKQDFRQSVYLTYIKN